MNEEFPRKEFDLKALNRWKLVQVVAVLPLALTVVLMIYFREAAEFHIVAFFLILIVGVLMPQISGDMIQSHVVLKGELSKEVRFLQEEVQNLRRELRGDHPDKEVPTLKIMK
jgi:uncharacterized membrane protein (UPF0182 family)